MQWHQVCYQRSVMEIVYVTCDGIPEKGLGYATLVLPVFPPRQARQTIEYLSVDGMVLEVFPVISDRDREEFAKHFKQLQEDLNIMGNWRI